MREPQTVLEAALLFDEFERVHGDSRPRRHWNKPYDRPRDDRQEPNQNRKGIAAHEGKHSSWVPVCFLCGIKGHKADVCPNRKSKQSK